MKRSVKIFLLMAFAYSWTVASALYLFRLPTYVLPVVSALYMFGPALAVLTLKVLRHPLPDLGIRFKPNRWWLVAWLLPVAITLLVLVVDLAMPGVELSTRWGDERVPGGLNPIWLPVVLISGMLAGITVNALAAFGEEVGWRGFLYGEMRGMGFWRMAFTVGVIWGVWHAPLILKGHNYPLHPVPGVLMMVLFTTLLSPLIFHIREKAGSTLAAAIFHGTLNGVAKFDVLLLKGGNDLLVGITGLSGLIVLSALNLGLYFLRKRS